MRSTQSGQQQEQFPPARPSLIRGANFFHCHQHRVSEWSSQEELNGLHHHCPAVEKSEAKQLHASPLA